jgi:hypothetical protein
MRSLAALKPRIRRATQSPDWGNLRQADCQAEGPLFLE